MAAFVGVIIRWMQVKTLWGMWKLRIRLMTLGFRRTDFSFFRKLVVRIP